MSDEKQELKMIKLVIDDKLFLYKSYMAFLKNGGIFINTNEPFEMHQKVLLILSLMDEPNKYPLRTTVVWKNQKTENYGYGFSFMKGDISKKAKSSIENYLSSMSDSNLPTFTM